MNSAEGLLESGRRCPLVSAVKIRFADCTLDIDARQLVRGGHDAHLPPKAFELLKLLVENRPRVLSKTELIERVWPGVFVSDASLAKVVSKIRKAIGQLDDTRIIRTVHGCGYAFAAELDDQQARAESAPVGPATCCLVCGRREFPLATGEHIVGRDANASIRLDSPKVSRQHAQAHRQRRVRHRCWISAARTARSFAGSA